MKKSYLLPAFIILISFHLCAQTITDVEGNVYNVVTIGTQQWMRENLKTGTYNDSTPIHYPGASMSSWSFANTGAYAWFMDDSAQYGSVYGALYNWLAVNPATNGGKNICPLNWHVPTHDEYTTLERAICTSGSCATDFPYDTIAVGWRGTNEGDKLKQAGTGTWNSGNTAVNSSQFTALPGSYRNSNGSYGGPVGNYGWFWTSTPFDANYSWLRALNNTHTDVSRNHGFDIHSGLSVRCVCNSPVKVQDLGFENKIRIYPNPAVDLVSIESAWQQASLQVFNSLGQRVYEAILTMGKNEIATGLWPKGIYLVRVSGQEGSGQTKIMVN